MTFFATVSGKIVAVREEPVPDGLDRRIVIDFVERVFVSGKLQDRNWEITCPRHKEQWVRRQAEKPYTVIAQLSQITGMSPIYDLKEGAVHAAGILQELLTL